MKLIQYLSDQGVLSKGCKHTIKDQELVKGYEAMILTRHIDDRMVTLQRQGTISFAMSSLGEEGAVVASAAALSMDDWIYPQYRECGCMFWRGYSPQDYIHHMFCNGLDSIKGRQMPNHFGSRELNVVTVSSPIGTQLPHAAGCGYGMKLRGDQAIAFCYFGEGTTSEGDFHAALNFAAVRKSPVIFFCRNNGWAISTPSDQQFHSEGIAEKGAAYNITSYKVDGNDYFAIHETVSKARKACLAGKGPVLIEAMTYRMGPHSTSDDPTGYRSDTEEKKWAKKDPVLRLRKYLESKKLWSASQEKKAQNAIKKQIDEAIQIAKDTDPPPLESLIEEVYFEVPATLKHQLEEVKRCL